MDELMRWISDRIPQAEMCTLIHGDFRWVNVHDEDYCNVMELFNSYKKFVRSLIF